MRLHLTSSDFPRWARNPNTGERLATAVHVQVAAQTVHHDATRPSRIVLPVIPPARG